MHIFMILADFLLPIPDPGCQDETDPNGSGSETLVQGEGITKKCLAYVFGIYRAKCFFYCRPAFSYKEL